MSITSWVWLWARRVLLIFAGAALLTVLTTPPAARKQIMGLALGAAAAPSPVKPLAAPDPPPWKVADSPPALRLTVADTERAPRATSNRQIEEAIIGATNRERVAQGREPLRESEAVRKVARAYAERQGKERFIGHYDPQGNSVGDRFTAAGIDYMAVGENIAGGENPRDPAEEAVRGWMSSAGHRRNLLESIYTEVGVGVYRDPDGMYFFVQDFRRPPSD